jgi:transposase
LERSVIEIDMSLSLGRVSMAERVRARRLSDEEGRQLQQIARRGKHGSIRVRRALIIMASASGTPVPAIARLVQADEDTVRQVIHRFNELGLACLDPRWAGGRPRRISPDETAYIVATALTCPEKLGMPFTRWSVRKLADYLAANPVRMVDVGRERLRQILRRHNVSFQRTRTWKESTDPDREAKLDRIEAVTTAFPERCFAFDQFGPLSIRPHHGGAWARWCKPVRLPATYPRAHGIRYFHGCYSLGDDQLWGVTRRRKSGDHTLAGGQPHPGRLEHSKDRGLGHVDLVQPRTAVGQLAARPVDLATLLGHLHDRVALPRQQRVQRLAGPGLGVVEPVKGGAGLPAQQPHTVQAEDGRRAMQRPPTGRDGVLDQIEQTSLDGRIHPRWDEAGGQSKGDFP